MPATTTATGPLARRDEIEIETKALVGVLIAGGAVGHAALGAAALTFLTGVLPPLL
jgi:hypothetical protein